MKELDSKHEGKVRSPWEEKWENILPLRKHSLSQYSEEFRCEYIRYYHFGNCIQHLPYMKISCTPPFYIGKERMNPLKDSQRNCELTFVVLKDIEHAIFKQILKWELDPLPKLQHILLWKKNSVEKSTGRSRQDIDDLIVRWCLVYIYFEMSWCGNSLIKINNDANEEETLGL